MEFLQQHWAVVAANPWLFATWATLVASGTWIVIHFLYQHRLELYKHRTEEDAMEIQRLHARIAEMKERLSKSEMSSAQPSPEEPESFDYPDAGDHGMSILGHSLTDLVVGQTYSMTAVVPTNGRLKVQLVGTSPRYLSEMPGGWGYNVSTRNWQASSYDNQDHTQMFTARGGEADLAFIPSRPGRITVRVFEGGRHHKPAWEKTLKVLDGGAR